jgi:hypothetical protein
MTLLLFLLLGHVHIFTFICIYFYTHFFTGLQENFYTVLYVASIYILLEQTDITKHRKIS